MASLPSTRTHREKLELHFPNQTCHHSNLATNAPLVPICIVLNQRHLYTQTHTYLLWSLGEMWRRRTALGERQG